MTTYAIEALHRDEGTVVLFEGWKVPQRAVEAVQDGQDVTVYTDTASYLIAVDHRFAQDLVLALEEGEVPIVEAEDWQIMGTVR